MIVRRILIGISGNRNALNGLSVCGYRKSATSFDNNNKDEVNEEKVPEKSEHKSSGRGRNSLRSHKQEKLIRVAIVGVPNAGKSTLINALAEHRVCPVSCKVHTTRNFSRAITVRDNTQIVFFDTPGLVKEQEMKKHHLEKSFVSGYRHSIQNADLIAVVHDISNSHTRNTLNPSVIEVLNEYPKVPSVLVLNKIDCLRSKRVLLDLVRSLTKGCLNGIPYGNKFDQRRRRLSVIEILNDLKKEEENKKNETKIDPNIEKPKPVALGYENFQQVFMVSALHGDGVTKVMEFLCSQAQVKPWLFDADTFTDRTPEDLIVQSVQAKLLDFLPQEIPYQLHSQMEFYSVDKGRIFASVLVTCPNKRVEKLVCGGENGKLRQITEAVTSDLIQTFEAPVSLTISTMPKIKND